jgi:Zn-finger nucleic acid-binding protein
MRCPIDQTELSPLEYEGCLVHTCRSCGGELLGGDALTHVVNVRDEKFSQDMKDGLASPARGAPVAQDHDLTCPFCEQGMQTLNYTGDSDVIIDRCMSCGAVWLDRDELEHVQILLERWQDEAPEKLRGLATELETARRRAQEQTGEAFQGSRFAFVNAVMNRLLDAA